MEDKEEVSQARRKHTQSEGETDTETYNEVGIPVFQGYKWSKDGAHGRRDSKGDNLREVPKKILSLMGKEYEKYYNWEWHVRNVGDTFWILKIKLTS